MFSVGASTSLQTVGAKRWSGELWVRFDHANDVRIFPRGAGEPHAGASPAIFNLLIYVRTEREFTMIIELKVVDFAGLPQTLTIDTAERAGLCDPIVHNFSDAYAAAVEHQEAMNQLDGQEVRPDTRWQRYTETLCTITGLIPRGVTVLTMAFAWTLTGGRTLRVDPSFDGCVEITVPTVPQ